MEIVLKMLLTKELLGEKCYHMKISIIHRSHLVIFLTMLETDTMYDVQLEILKLLVTKLTY